MSLQVDREESGVNPQKSNIGAGSPSMSFAAIAGITSAGMGIDNDIKLFAETISEFINTNNLKVDVVVVKKGTNGSFYTNVILLMKRGNIALYYTLLMANTGVTQLRATEVVEHYKNTQNKAPLVLPALSIEKNLRATIEAELIKRGKVTENDKIIPADGLRIVEKNLTEEFSTNVARVALKYMTALFHTLDGSYNDTALYEAIKGWDIVKDDISSNTSGSMVLLGETRYINWVSKTYGANQTMIEYNKGDEQQSIAQVAGNVTLMIAEKGGVRTSKNDSGLIAVPIITVNTMDLTVPSVGSVLFAIYQATILAAGDRWIKVIVDAMKDQNGTAVPGRDPGVLEKYINSLELDKPTAISLAKEKNEAVVYNHIKNMCSPSPVIVLDNILFGMASSETALFTIAADPHNPDRVAASRTIIEAAVNITGGNFPADFPVDEIFTTPKISLPTGTFVSKGGEVKSIDEIDTVFIATADNGDGLIEKFVRIENTSGQFYNKVLFLSELEAKARRKFNIDGEKIRMVLSDRFISTLFNAVNATGINLDATDGPAINVRQEFITLSQLGGGLGTDVLNSSIGSHTFNPNQGFNVDGLAGMTGGFRY